MLFPDFALTKRLELHESWSSAAHADTQAQIYPETGAVVEPLGAGCAVFCGKKSPLSGVYGWGLAGPLAEADLDRVETLYRSRGLPVRVRVCPLADSSSLRLLGERGYVVEDFMNVYARPIEPLGEAPRPVPGLTVRVATEEEARLWFAREGAGGDWAEPDGVAFMTIRCTRKANTRLFLARLDGEAVGAGALEVHEGVAGLMAAGTLPAFRNRGIHTALLHARLAAAAEDGCDVAMVHTRPGAVSQRNVLRAGFPLMYTVTTVLARR
jgi:GNAT superfamily N-acetyltransferase